MAVVVFKKKRRMFIAIILKIQAENSPKSVI